MTTARRPRLTWAQAESLVAAARRRLRRCEDRVHRLRSNRIFVNLRRFTGVTRIRCDQAYAALRLVESRLPKWQAAVVEAEALVARHRAAPGAAGSVEDLLQLEHLLRDGTIPLLPEEMRREDRPPPGSHSPQQRFTLSYLDNVVSNDLAEADRVVDEVFEVWKVLEPMLDDITTGLHECRELARAAGREEPPELVELRGRVDATRDAVENDPLALRSGGEPVDPAHLHRLEDDLAEILRGLTPEEFHRLLKRLRLYRRTARSAGCAAAPALVSRYEAAEGLIRARADLDAAEQAVLGYSAEVWRLTRRGGTGGE